MGEKKGNKYGDSQIEKKNRDRNSQVIFYVGKFMGSYNKKAELADKIVKIKNRGIFEFHIRQGNSLKNMTQWKISASYIQLDL